MDKSDIVNAATQYLARNGWGAQGKMLGISRMFQDADMTSLKKDKILASLRPRGVLSGFLAIVPDIRTVVYLPPIAGKTQPRQIRMRLPDDLLETGAVFSAYWNEASELILEDVLVWRGISVWSKMPFSERWEKCMRELSSIWQPDDTIQGCSIRFAEFKTLASLQKPGEREVVEFIPEAPHTKRMIWLNTQEAEATTQAVHMVHREVAIGPDIFSVWSEKGERLGIAYIKTLATSRALRVHAANEFRVKTTWNKMFDRHEIIGIA